MRGKEITPFLLDYIHRHTDGASVAVNLEIVRGNCALGRRDRARVGRAGDLGPPGARVPQAISASDARSAGLASLAVLPDGRPGLAPARDHPCSTAGTVTGPVERRLEQFSLPHPGPLTLGQVEIRPLDDGEQPAQYVAAPLARGSG